MSNLESPMTIAHRHAVHAESAVRSGHRHEAIAQYERACELLHQVGKLDPLLNRETVSLLLQSYQSEIKRLSNDLARSQGSNAEQSGIQEPQAGSLQHQLAQLDADLNKLSVAQSPSQELSSLAQENAELRQAVRRFQQELSVKITTMQQLIRSSSATTHSQAAPSMALQTELDVAHSIVERQKAQISTLTEQLRLERELRLKQAMVIERLTSNQAAK